MIQSKEMHNLSILGYILGIAVIIGSFIKWELFWRVNTYFIFGVSIGLLIILFSYIHNWMRNQDENISQINHRLDSFATFWTGTEKETIKGEVLGQR